MSFCNGRQKSAVSSIGRWIFAPVSGLLIAAFFIPSASALIGGQVDFDERYQSVVSLVSSGSIRCSATKVAERDFLTAAHCVSDTGTGGPAEGFLPGDSILVSNLTQPGGRADYKPLRIESVRLHRGYRRALERFFRYKEERISAFRERYSGQDLDRPVRTLEADNHFTARFPDIAIIRVLDETPEIPAASIDCRPLSAEDPVHLVGYGIEGFTHDPPGGLAAYIGRRKWGESWVIRVDAVNFYTYAHLKRAGSPSLAPGDSGGPVMREGRVVGVNGTVYGLSRIEAARSNMAVKLNGLGSRDSGPSQEGCREFFKFVTVPRPP